MARKIYNQQKVQTIEASSGTVSAEGSSFRYKGFNSRNTTKNFKQYDLDLVKQDLLNHFNIRKGEKLQLPKFGTVIWDMLFEPMTSENIDIIVQDVEEIVNRDPRVKARNVSVDATDKGVLVEMDLEYLELNATEQLRINFDRRNTE